MVTSKGALKYCPFRTYTTEEPYVIDGENTVRSEWFMPCEKENCICYQREEVGELIKEYCHREKTVYQAITQKAKED